MATKKLGLTRDQLAMFLKDHEQIKQFESLFDVANTAAPDKIDSIDTEAANAVAIANDALSSVHKLAQDAAISSAIADIKAEEALLRLDRLVDETSVSLAVVEAKTMQAMNLIKQMSSDLDVLQMLPAQKPLKRTRYGQFYDTTTQTAAAANTAYAITYNTTDLSYGVFLRPGNSEIEIDTEGVYNFQFSVQLDKTSGGTASFWIWPRVNGVDVSNSASQIRIQGNDAEIFSAANFFLDLKAGDYVQFMWAVSDTSVQLQYFAAAAPVPAIPSIILTVSNNIRGQS